MKPPSKKTFGEIWSELNAEQREYLEGYIDRQRRYEIFFESRLAMTKVSAPSYIDWLCLELTTKQKEIDDKVSQNVKLIERAEKAESKLLEMQEWVKEFRFWNCMVNPYFNEDEKV